MPSNQHVLRFPATPSGLAHAAGTLQALLDAEHVAGGPRYNVELAFEEVVANIVRHGAPTGDVEAIIRFSDDEIVMTFEDDGVPFDPREHPEPVVPTDDPPVGGLGLVLLRKITRIAYERTGQDRNVLTLTLPARAPAAR